MHWVLLAALACPAHARELAGRWYPDVEIAAKQTGIPSTIIAAVLYVESPSDEHAKEIGNIDPHQTCFDTYNMKHIRAQ